MRILKIFALTSVIFLFSCSETPKTKPSLLIYCGVTMTKPVSLLAREFEKKYAVKINITQGGSQDLYLALKTSKIGDLYIPGSVSYRVNNQADNLLGRHEILGINQLALIVAKNNPKNLTNDLKQLTNPNLNVVLGDASLGSVGRVSLKILKKHGIAKQAYKNAIYLTSDSRHIAKAFKQKEADIALSWLATSFWTENKKHFLNFRKSGK